MNPEYITLISYGHFEKKFIETIAESVKHEFIFPVILEESRIDLSLFYDPARKQYDANKLLLEIDSKFSSGSLKTVGLFRVDLFIPILTYIYGQAFLSGRSAIALSVRTGNWRSRTAKAKYGCCLSTTSWRRARWSSLPRGWNWSR